MRARQIPAMRLPMAVVYAAPTVGFALASIRQVQVIVLYLRDLFGKNKGVA